VEASRPARERLAFERVRYRGTSTLWGHRRKFPPRLPPLHIHMRAYTRVSIRRTYYHPRQCTTTRLIRGATKEVCNSVCLLIKEIRPKRGSASLSERQRRKCPRNGRFIEKPDVESTPFHFADRYYQSRTSDYQDSERFDRKPLAVNGDTDTRWEFIANFNDDVNSSVEIMPMRLILAVLV